jgi:hypothetical protein
MPIYVNKFYILFYGQSTLNIKIVIRILTNMNNCFLKLSSFKPVFKFKFKF